LESYFFHHADARATAKNAAGTLFADCLIQRNAAGPESRYLARCNNWCILIKMPVACL
jgi:hypothetical protein